MFKKILAVLLTLLLLLCSFFGCKNKEKEKDENTEVEDVAMRSATIKEETPEKITEEIETGEFGKIKMEHSTETSYDTFINAATLAKGDTFYIGDYRYTFMKKNSTERLLKP